MDKEIQNSIYDLRLTVGAVAKLLETFGPNLHDLAQAIKHLDLRLQAVEEQMGIQTPSVPWH